MSIYQMPVAHAKQVLQQLPIEVVIGVSEDIIQWRLGDEVVARGVMRALASQDGGSPEDLQVVVYPGHPQSATYLGTDAIELFDQLLETDPRNIRLSQDAIDRIEEVFPDEERRERMMRVFGLTPAPLKNGTDEENEGDDGDDEEEPPPLAAEPAAQN